jgi:hypothetical protein
VSINIIIPTWDMERGQNAKKRLEEWASPDLDVFIVCSPNTSAVDNMATGGTYPGDILGFLHDDVEVHHRGWDVDVQEFFASHPKCGMLGFGGAIGLGTDDLYQDRYDYHQLARINYMSNSVDAEDHGIRTTKPRRVAVLDGFSQIIRRTAYNEVGGWEKVRNMGISFHMYDAAMACLMAEKGWEVWLLPLSCIHKGGGTSASKQYDAWLRRQGINGDQQIHREAHKIIYRRFKNTLPLRVKE